MNAKIYLVYQNGDLVCATVHAGRARKALENRIHKRGIRYTIDGIEGAASITEQIRALRRDWKGGTVSLAELNDRLADGHLAVVEDGENL